MKTISQVAALSCVSTRTLQYYDEIGLLKPSALTDSGYRLYDEEALQTLQQILFFKELGFQLKEIREILQKPEFDRISAFKKQKELLLLKRNRTDRLIQLLSRLEKGEPCMSFKEFDLSDYIQALEHFKNNSADAILKYWGTEKNFDLFLRKVREDEDEIAKLAIKQYGSVEKYTEAMKYNLEHFSEVMEKQHSQMPEEIVRKSEELYRSLTADMSKEVSSDEIQQIVREIIAFIQECSTDVLSLTENFWNTIIHAYSSDYVKSVTDTKYGTGAADYISRALRLYLENEGILNA